MTGPEPSTDPAAGPSPAAAAEGPPAASLPPAATAAGAGRRPSAQSNRGSARTAPKQPGPVVVGKAAAGPGDQPEALSGKAFRDALKAAQSAKAKAQRNQRARPWTKRDPYRKAVPGGRVAPPKDGES